jgi:uncharacterized delta-60 repeat protein
MSFTHPRSLLTCIFACTSTIAGAAADGEPDLTFGDAGFRLLDTAPVDGVPTNERGLFAHRLSDGRLLVAMQAQRQDGQRAITAVFSPNGVDLLASATAPQQFGVLDPPIRGFGVDASERLLIAGSEFDAISNRIQPVIIRALPPDYAPDPDFGVDGAARPFGSLNYAVALALFALPDGRSIVCGDVLVPTLGLRGYCFRLSASGAIDNSFGTLVFNPPDVDATSIGAVRADSSGRLLLAGHARMSGSADTVTFSARLTADGELDSDYCASGCDDSLVLQAGPGYRINAMPTAGEFPCFDVRERPNGKIAQGNFNGPTPGALIQLSFLDSGRLDVGVVTTFGKFNGSVGCGSALSQTDNRTLLVYTARIDGVQVGGMDRLRPQPAPGAIFDPTFSPSANRIRAPLGSGDLSNSNECNFGLLEDDGILCVGLTRVSDTPLNTDLMLYRVTNGAPQTAFGDGFEP